MITKEIVTAYLETLLWSETFNGMGDDGEDPLIIEGTEYKPGTPLDQIEGCDVSDLATLAPKLLEEAEEDLEGFRTYCLEDIGIDPFKFFDPCQVAHDFALSRNGHGSGFFDGCYLITAQGPEEVRQSEDRKTDLADDLQSAAKTFGTFGLQVWIDEDGNLKMESHG